MKKSPMKRIYKINTIDITKGENELQFTCASKKELKTLFNANFEGVFKPNIRSIEYFQLKTDTRRFMKPTLPR